MTNRAAAAALSLSALNAAIAAAESTVARREADLADARADLASSVTRGATVDGETVAITVDGIVLAWVNPTCTAARLLGAARVELEVLCGEWNHREATAQDAEEEDMLLPWLNNGE